MFENVERSFGLLGHFKFQTLLKINIVNAVTSAFLLRDRTAVIILPLEIEFNTVRFINSTIDLSEFHFEAEAKVDFPSVRIQLWE